MAPQPQVVNTIKATQQEMMMHNDDETHSAAYVSPRMKWSSPPPMRDAMMGRTLAELDAVTPLGVKVIPYVQNKDTPYLVSVILDDEGRVKEVFPGLLMRPVI